MNKTKAILKVLGIDVDGKELTKEEIAEIFKQFKEVKKTLEDYEKKVLKPYFFKSAEEFGYVTENGGYRVELEDGTGWEKQARVKITVDQESAVKLLKNKNLNEYITQEKFIPEEKMKSAIAVLSDVRPDLIETKEKVEESVLEQVYLESKITDEELAEIVERKVTYALVEIKPKKTKS